MTTTSKADVLTFIVTRTLKAPVELVYKGWTEPEQMAKWIGCDQMCTVKVTQDFRVGGEFRYDMNLNDGEQVAIYGVFQKIEPNRKLSYTWTNTSKDYPAKDTLVTVEFIAKGDITELKLTHANLNDANCLHGHTLGWTASLDRFVARFE